MRECVCLVRVVNDFPLRIHQLHLVFCHSLTRSRAGHSCWVVPHRVLLLSFTKHTTWVIVIALHGHPIERLLPIPALATFHIQNRAALLAVIHLSCLRLLICFLFFLHLFHLLFSLSLVHHSQFAKCHISILCSLLILRLTFTLIILVVVHHVRTTTILILLTAILLAHTVTLAVPVIHLVLLLLVIVRALITLRSTTLAKLHLIILLLELILITKITSSLTIIRIVTLLLLLEALVLLAFVYAVLLKALPLILETLVLHLVLVHLILRLVEVIVRVLIKPVLIVVPIHLAASAPSATVVSAFAHLTLIISINKRSITLRLAFTALALTILLLSHALVIHAYVHVVVSLTEVILLEAPFLILILLPIGSLTFVRKALVLRRIHLSFHRSSAKSIVTLLLLALILISEATLVSVLIHLVATAPVLIHLTLHLHLVHLLTLHLLAITSLAFIEIIFLPHPRSRTRRRS